MNVLHPYLNKVTRGDCIEVLRRFPDQCIDLVITDPPYLLRRAKADPAESDSTSATADSAWFQPAFTEIARVLRSDRYCVSFYGWSQVEQYVSLWKQLRLFPVGHFVFVKSAATRVSHTLMRHEQAYLLAKGCPVSPEPAPDVMDLHYSGNALHPAQKPVTTLIPLIMVLINSIELTAS